MNYRALNLAQGTPAWKAWRQAGVGASDLIGILGLAPPWPPPLPTRESVFRAKVFGEQVESNYAMRRGNFKEPDARAAYLRARPSSCRVVCVESTAAPWMRASLDGLCSQPDREPWILELKVPAFQPHDYALAGFVPDYYVPQVQWQLLITGLSRLDYCSYSENARFPAQDRIAIVEVSPDHEKQAWILDEVSRFWLEVLEARVAFDKEAGKTHSIGEVEFA